MALGSLVGSVLVRSPMLTIEEHMQLALETVEQLQVFLTVTQEDDWDRAEEIQTQIARTEAEADKLKQQLRKELSGKLLMPIPRSDLLDLISAQDKIANRAEDIAGLMLGRKMAFPGKLNKQVNEFVTLTVHTTQAALDAIQKTHGLFRSGFAYQEAREVDRVIAEVERLERRSDKAQSKLRARLYKLETKLQPVEVMFLYQIITWLGNVSDRAETVAHKLLLISKS